MLPLQSFPLEKGETGFVYRIECAATQSRLCRAEGKEETHCSLSFPCALPTTYLDNRYKRGPDESNAPTQRRRSYTTPSNVEPCEKVTLECINVNKINIYSIKLEIYDKYVMIMHMDNVDLTFGALTPPLGTF